ncbi:MAG: phosphohistidine phosphatase SixA [Thermodesulfovibrionales bacterium]|nr:phosphohistidine phosphatase SixA [Thermodesulfovibrionales bacterium]
MYLYLVQHGKAMDKEENPERPLSPEGRADVEKMASFLSGIEVARIIESGKLRATETAGIIGNALGKDVQQGEDLSPLDNPGEWVGTLNKTSDNTMLVGHLPHLGKLASLLLAGAPEMELVEFSTAGVLCLKRDDDAWTVQWMAIPDILR